MHKKKLYRTAIPSFNEELVFLTNISAFKQFKRQHHGFVTGNELGLSISRSISNISGISVLVAVT